MLIALFITTMVFIFLHLLFKLNGIPFVGRYAHPLGLFIAIQVCVFSLPGVIMISFLSFPSERYAGIRFNSLYNIGLWYTYSLCILLVIIFLGILFFKPHSYKNSLYHTGFLDHRWRECKIITIISLLLIFVQVIFFAKPPILYLINGQAEEAYLVRVAMQNDPSRYYPPFIRSFLVFFTTFQAYYVYYIYNRLKNKNWGVCLVLIVSIIIAVFQSLYEAQKAPLIMLLIGLVFIRYIFKPKIISTAFYVLSLIMIAVILVSFLLDIDINSAIEGVVSRIFLGQNQGFYNIIEHIKPDSKYWFQDFYFAGTLGLNPSRADIDVIPYIYSNRDDVVNVNSYFLGQAWSMFGTLGLGISPVIVGLAISFYIIVLDRLIKYDVCVFLPYFIYFIPSVMLNQSFTYFLYGKYFLLGLFNVFVFFLIVRLFNVNKLTLR
ncbi:hypothetical protein [Escherichia albertii]|uniref:hypothetical protein n=1 Tax=Escherichia albertii TaxID=208962 RepID=UPI0012FFEF31|nr:hypothetical protein [Escherichia albertii]